MPAFLDYHPHFAPSPFPGVICASVNDAVVHAIPGPPPARATGDLLSVDCGAYLDGWCGDAAISLVVGADAGPRRPRRSSPPPSGPCRPGIAAAVPGGQLGDVGRRDRRGGPRGRLRACSPTTAGTASGAPMHEAPHVPNEGRAGRGHAAARGPGDRHRADAARRRRATTTVHDADGWTLRTADGSRAAHVEHTVAITDDGPRVLTLA